MAKTAIVTTKKVNAKIVFLRGQRVILDADLADLYEVEVRHLNQQVKRNAKRFPLAFRFQLSAQELKVLRSQNVISSKSHGGRRYRPYAFTEHGAIMAATVLNSERAIEMSVFVVLAFVSMRRAIGTNRQVLAKLAEVERRLENHDADIQDLMEAIRELINPPDQPRRRIGFEAPSNSTGVRTSAPKGRTLRFANKG
jgi:translation elongation factor EF-Tu-like GTPase